MTPATRPTDCSLCCPQEDVSAASDPSGYQANEQSELIHPTAHSHFTICHALHFNSTVQTGLHVHTALIQQSICYHWIPSNAHT